MKAISLFFIVTLAVLMVLIPSVAPLPTDRITLFLFIYLELLCSGMIIFFYNKLRETNPVEGLLIIR